MSEMRQWLVSNTKEVDVCNQYIGATFRQQKSRVKHTCFREPCRLYLDPDVFHLPPSGVRVETSPQWKKVKDHIGLMAMKRGNPVVCRSGNEGSKIFRCARCYGKRGGDI